MKNFDMRPDSYVLNIEKASVESMLSALVETVAMTTQFLVFPGPHFWSGDPIAAPTSGTGFHLAL
jgi:hypothetical protein